jgi:hypothetical protein
LEGSENEKNQLAVEITYSEMHLKEEGGAMPPSLKFGWPDFNI